MVSMTEHAWCYNLQNVTIVAIAVNDSATTADDGGRVQGLSQEGCLVLTTPRLSLLNQAIHWSWWTSHATETTHATLLHLFIIAISKEGQRPCRLLFVSFDGRF